MKHLLFTVFVLFAMTLQASIEPTVTTLSNKSIKISFDHAESKAIEVSLLNEAGQLLYSDSFDATSEKGKILNLRNLPNGKYSIQIESNQIIAESAIMITNELAIVSDRDMTYKPQIEISDKYVSFNILSLGKEINATFIDENHNDVLLNESYENNSTLSKVYDISKLAQGNYTVIITVGNHATYRSFSI